jgi:spermidine synthase
MRYLCISLWTFLSLSHVALAEVDLKQNALRRQVWAKELARWSGYCLGRAERPDPIFNGCVDRVNAIRATQALFREMRLAGFAKTHPHLPSADRVSQWLASNDVKDSLSPTERMAMIDLAYEGVIATGEITWYHILLQQVVKSSWFGAVQCPLDGACATELLTVLRAGYFVQNIGKQKSIQSPLESYIISRIPALIPVAQYLTQPHPLGTLKSDHNSSRSDSLWALRAELASISLNQKQLKDWWHIESKVAADLVPVKVKLKRQYGINFSRMRGLGRLLKQLDEPSLFEHLNESYQTHARAAMELYLKNRRNYHGYTSKINALGVIALSAHLQETDFPWYVPPRRWLKQKIRVLPKHLPNEEIRASGMFSEIAIRDVQGSRGLYFIRPNGQQLLETEINLKRPDFLQVRYTQDMLAVYPFFKTRPQRALLIGLGGGAMVHALRAYDPQLHLDAVEIDAVVVRFAREFFGVKALELAHTKDQGQLRVITEDGFTFLAPESNEEPYDLIWMDAFLQPTSETDSTGSPLNLKTVSFLKRIAEKRLTSHGVIAININHHKDVKRDFDSIRAAFVASTIWQVPETGNYIAIGFKSKPTMNIDQLYQSAHDYTLSQATPFNYQSVMKRALENLIPTP